MFTALGNAPSAFCYRHKEIPLVVESTRCASDGAREFFIRNFELLFLLQAARETLQWSALVVYHWTQCSLNYWQLRKINHKIAPIVTIDIYTGDPGDTEFHLTVSLHQSYKGQFTSHLYHVVCEGKRCNCLQEFCCFQFHVTVRHTMINENTSLMQLLSIYFT